MADINSLPVGVIGAGPVGLAAAAHLLARSLTLLILEKGAQVGATVAEWAHVRVFSPWEFNVDAEARRLLEATGWTMPDPDHLPTGAELIRDYLAPLAAHPAVAPHLMLGSEVVAVAREGHSKPAGVGRDEATPLLATLIDPNLHSCGSVRPHGAVELSHPEKDFYIVGTKSYGRAPTFLMTTGYEQVRSVVAELSGDLVAAREVHLKLPETGVCKTGPTLSGNGCCGGAPKANDTACCVADEEAKAADKVSCGCSARAGETAAAE